MLLYIAKSNVLSGVLVTCELTLCQKLLCEFPLFVKHYIGKLHVIKKGYHYLGLAECVKDENLVCHICLSGSFEVSILYLA